MSGHNKWSQIRTKKAAEDAKKSKIFSLLSRQLTLEARASSGDRESPRLRAIIDRARAANMPRDNIDRAIEKGMGSGSTNYEAVRYEAYGPGGVALLIDGITDNKNRTTAEVKHVLATHGGTLAAQGSVLWAFQKSDGGWEATAPVTLDTTLAEHLQRLIEALEEHEDVERVFTNAARP